MSYSVHQEFSLSRLKQLCETTLSTLLPPQVRYTEHTFLFLFTADVDEQLKSCDKYISLLMDEMHIKSDLVYGKHSSEHGTH